MDVLQEHVPIQMEGDFQPETLFEILVHAASNAQSIEQTSKTLDACPTGNDVRYHLNKLENLVELEEQLNQALRSRTPGRLQNSRQKVAIDLNLIPYYGTPSEQEESYIIRSQAKAGTCSFYAYATVYVISRGKRVTLALHAVRRDETLVCIITRLLDQMAPLHISIKRLYLDRGFYCVPVIRWLQACDIPLEMPVIVRGKQGGTRALVQRKRTYKTSYTMHSQSYGSVTFQVWVVGTYEMGRRGHHGVKYLAFVVYKVSLGIRALPGDYRKRFGIESSYRLKNLSRIRTTTKNPVTRLLYVGIAFLLVNLWVFIIWTYVSKPRKGGRQLFQTLFPLRTMLQFLRQVVERKTGVKTEIYLPAEVLL
ncbi:MAG: ISH3 family transposase [Desulfobacteraceae bacterium]|nr:ISH3 family transposase [Desulfobacteraceae bacterium]